jgi:hypothetical protein
MPDAHRQAGMSSREPNSKSTEENDPAIWNKASALTAKAVRLGHFARPAEGVQSAPMLVMQEHRKLRSYRFTLRPHRLPE